MKVVVPIVSDEEIVPLVKAGASEFYCGVYTDDYSDNLNFAIWNKRPSLRMNFRSFDKLKHAIKLAHDYGKKVYLTVNSLGYAGSHYVWLEKLLTTTYSLGIDGYIVSDIGMIEFIKALDLNCDIQISTTAVTYNSEAVQFYKNMGATRIIFPRHIGVNEMKEVTKKYNDIQYEIFMSNSRCPNEDGLCTIEHALNFKNKIHGCFFNRNFRIHSEGEDIHYEGFCKFIEHACGVCVIPELLDSPIEYLKIVGREKPLRNRIKDTIFISRVLNHLNNKDEFNFSNTSEIKKFYEEFYEVKCDGNCYYPERR